MHFSLLAFYGGPDQIMGVTSGLASLLGLLLIFWHKVVTTFFKIVRKLRRTDGLAASATQKQSTTETP